jgi:hypothetical protein
LKGQTKLIRQRKDRKSKLGYSKLIQHKALQQVGWYQNSSSLALKGSGCGFSHSDNVKH